MGRMEVTHGLAKVWHMCWRSMHSLLMRGAWLLDHHLYPWTSDAAHLLI